MCDEKSSKRHISNGPDAGHRVEGKWETYKKLEEKRNYGSRCWTRSSMPATVPAVEGVVSAAENDNV